MARILSGLKATGIPYTGITAGTKVTGLVFHILERTGSARASRVDSITTAIGTAIAADLNIATNGIMIVHETMTGIASTTTITSQAATQGAAVSAMHPSQPLCHLSSQSLPRARQR